MRLAHPVSSLIDQEARPAMFRAVQRLEIIGNFAFVQALVQLLGFASGILIVRTLEARDYGWFTIANTMQGTINVLADIGITVALVSIGGRVWQDRHRFGQLVNTALKLRKYLGAIVVVVTAPILFFLLARNGASPAYGVALVALVVVGVVPQLSLNVLTVVPRLRSDIRRIQTIDFTGAISRLIAVVAVTYILLNAATAIALATAVYFLQYALLRRYAASVIDLTAGENADDRAAMLDLIRKLAANSIFFCLQSQIAVFLISVFARRATAVAEVGALGRLAMIFAVLSTLLTNVFVPAFARCQNPGRLRWLFLGITGGVTVFGVLVLASAALFPREFLFVLGNKYSHLDRELLLMIGGAVLSSIAATLWALNSSRAWVKGSWLYIPLTLGTQIALIPFLDFSTVSGVLLFNIASAVPTLLLNLALSYRGFRSLNLAPA